jgi:hypothetical protein
MRLGLNRVIAHIAKSVMYAPPGGLLSRRSALVVTRSPGVGVRGWRIHGRIMPCVRLDFIQSEGDAAGFEPRHRTHREYRDACASPRSGRKVVAHSASYGTAATPLHLSPVRGERTICDRVGSGERQVFRPAGAWGIVICIRYPRLAPWATGFRPLCGLGVSAPVIAHIAKTAMDAPPA